VHRLDRDAVRVLVAGRYALEAGDRDRLVTWLDQRTSGNAFFTTQLLHALAEARVLRPDGARWVLGSLDPVVVPVQLRQVIETRALRLDEEAQHLLAVAALIAHEVSFPLWQAVTEREEETLYAVAEAAIRARLVDPTADGTGIRFVHALVREALVEGMLPFRRRGLHRRIGEVVARLPAVDPDTVAYHFEHAGDARATEWLITGGERAARAYAWLVAADRFLAALSHLGETPDDVRLRSLLLVRVALLRQYADLHQSGAYAEEAALLAEQGGDTALAAFATFVQGFLRSLHVDEGRRGIAAMEAALAALDALPEVDFSQMEERIGYGMDLRHCRALFVYRLAACGQYREALSVGEPLLSQELPRLVASTPFEDPQGYLHVGIGVAYATLGQPAAARTAFAHARVIFRDRGHFLALASTAARQLHLLHFACTADDLAERERLVADMAEGYPGGSQVTTFAMSHTAYVYTAFLEGAWKYLGTHAPGLLGYHNPIAEGELARLAQAQGERTRAWHYIRSIFPHGPVAEADESRHGYLHVPMRLAAALALDEEDPVTARTWLELHDRWQTHSGAVLWRAEGELLWARHDRLLGRHIEAYRRARRALTLASEPRQPLALLAAHRTLGELDTEARRHAAAREHLDAALALADACRAPYERALTLLAVAELRAATGDAERAHSVLDEARAICIPLGAQPALARADALAEQLQTTQARSVLPAGLTEREVEVLRLVAEGLTNAEAAERLSLSPRTVDFHLRTIYGKLGVSSRAAATRFMLEHHLN
jgi:DNA-binding CsgD family transcriptional regulator